MMLKLILCFLFCLPFSLPAQRKYSQAELNRLADLGKLWGMIHYFHPAMATGEIITDSLIVRNAASLAEDPSKENFKRVVADMLAQTNDPFTKISANPEPEPDSAVIFSTHPDSLTIHRLSNGVLYIAIPTSVIKNPALLNQKHISVPELSKATGVIFDFRNKKHGDYEHDEDFTVEFFRKYLGSMISKKEFRGVYRSYIQHNGFVSQNVGDGGIYSSGWKSASDGTVYLISDQAQKLTIPVSFVVNRFNQPSLTNILRSLQFAGKCSVITEEDPYWYRTRRLYYTTLSDSTDVEITIGYQMIGNNFLAPVPDTVIACTMPGNEYMETCSRYMLNNHNRLRKPETANMDYVHPRPLRDSSLFVGTGARLLGLYNYWNTIQYFYPSKNLIGRDWNAVLYEYIPQFINAKDTFAYYWAIAGLVSEIHDSHGGLGMFKNRYIIGEKFYAKPPLRFTMIEGRMHIIDKVKDSAQNLEGVHIWDELVKVNGIPVKQYAENWRKKFSASNETGYYDLVSRFYVLAGEKNTDVQVTLKRGNRYFDVNLKRTVSRSNWLSDSLVNFSARYPVAKILPGNIGYVNLGILTHSEVDSVMNMLKDTKGIIFDVRNYPKGTSWDIAPYLVDKPVNTHLNKQMSVNYTSLFSRNHNEITESNYHVILPRKDTLRYYGKVVILANKFAQSHAEYSIMMLQGAGKGTVIGSQTMGADGNVSVIIFPGGYYTYFSALGVHYPDGTITQRVGVKINIPVKTTLDGLKAGKDELLERAKLFLKTGR